MLPIETLAEPLANVPVGIGGQENSVLVEQPPVHGIAGVDVLGDCVLHEVARGDDRDLARAHIGLLDDAADAAPVVSMGMGVDYGGDRQPLAHVLLEELDAARATSALTRGSITIQPVSPRTKEMSERSKPRT